MMGMGENKKTITLPPSCIDPSTVKIGQDVDYKIHGKVKGVDEMTGVTIELSEEGDEEDYDDYEADAKTSEKMGKKMKEKMKNSKALEEYQ